MKVKLLSDLDYHLENYQISLEKKTKEGEMSGETFGRVFNEIQHVRNSFKDNSFFEAIAIISKYHSTKMILNRPTANGIVPSEKTIHISDCCAAVINDLKKHGFSLSMNDGLLSVDKY